jgi:hypothetical protein
VASRVRRGGSWNEHPRHLRAAIGFEMQAGERTNRVGFRVCRAERKSLPRRSADPFAALEQPAPRFSATVLLSGIGGHHAEAKARVANARGSLVAVTRTATVNVDAPGPTTHCAQGVWVEAAPDRSLDRGPQH